MKNMGNDVSHSFLGHRKKPINKTHCIEIDTYGNDGWFHDYGNMRVYCHLLSSKYSFMEWYNGIL